MKKSSPRFIACLWTFLHLSAFVKGSFLYCNDRQCDRDETESLSKTTTEMALSGCVLSLGNVSGHGRLSGLTAGAVYEVFLNCSGCCQKVTTTPYHVTNLQVTRVTTSEITVNWTKPEGNYSFFMVQWTDGKASQQEKTFLPSKTITGLSAGTMYKINVTTLADDEKTESQTATVSQYTKPGPIPEAYASSNTSAVSLTWKPPIGEVFSYEVKWNNTSKYVNESFTVLPNLIPGTSYTVTIASVAGDKQTGEPYVLTTVTRPEKPEKITATSGTDYLDLKWTLPRGKADFYKVNISNPDLSYFANNRTSVKTARFGDLYPGRLFVITVTAVAGNQSSASDRISFATVPTPPGLLVVSQKTNASLHLQWKTPHKMEGAPNISYKVTYQKPGGQVETANTGNESVVLSQLSSGTSYNLTVYTVGPQNLMSSAVDQSEYTLPNPVLNLAASPLDTTSIQVAWSSPHGAQTYYEYSVDTYDLTGTHVNHQTIVNNTTIVQNLEPGTKYNVTVITLAPLKTRSATEHTVASTIPKAVPELQVVDFNTTAVQLHWSKSSDYKDSYVYLLTVLQDNTTIRNVTTEIQMYTFSNLIPGTAYEFFVWTVVEGLKSKSQNTLQYTRPEVVSNLRFIGTTTTMSLSWSVPAGKVESFIVMLSNSSGGAIRNDTLKNSTSSLFPGLKPGVLYCAVVTSRSGPLQSNSSEICNATFPNPPGPVRVDLQTVHSINFTWNPPDDMDHNQYNFSVKGVSIGPQKWFFLSGLQSGTSNSISVVTIGVLGYRSTEVQATNYTRPYPVTELEAEEITTGSVSLTWKQPEMKSDYSYTVLVANGSDPLKVTTLNANISGLVSGSNYTFSVFARAGDGTLADPGIKSVFTRPYEIPNLKADTINSSAVRLVWGNPQQHRPDYTFRVETTVCASQNESLGDNFTVISELNPGTRCTICVFVQAADGIESKPRCISQYTMPEAVQLGMSSQGSNMSILVLWKTPPGNVELYSVHLNGSSTVQSQEVNWTDNSLLFEDLSAGSLYSAKVISHSGPFNASSEFVTNATFPNQPGKIEIVSKTTNSIEAMWTEPLLMNHTQFYYRLTIAPTEGNRSVNTSNMSHTFDELLPGTPYNISVATVGVLGFRSQGIHANSVTTRPLRVPLLYTSAKEENITVKWLRADDYKEGYRYLLSWESSDWPVNGSIVTNQTMHTVGNLVPGSRYNFSVISETRDGTQSAPKWISNCTDASPVRELACDGPDTPDAKLILSWTKPSGLFHDFRININNAEVIRGTNACNQSCSRTISDLKHYTSYHVTMETLSCGQPASPVSLHCKSGITDPPIPESYESLVSEKGIVYNGFTIQINSSLLNETNGPIAQFGVLVTENFDESDTADMKQHLGKTYQEWIEKKTRVYLATVKERKVKTRIHDEALSVHIGDGSKWKGYTNGELRGNRRYHYAIVLFTRLIPDGDLVNKASMASITKFISVEKLPQDPAVISAAVGTSLGIFSVLFIVLIGFVIYWRRLSKKESSDIQIHSMRSAAVKLEDYEAYYKKQKADSNCGFAEEFEDLRPVGTNQSRSSALIQENKAKNRYNNVLPYDHSRVKLSIIHGSPYDDYINANYMPGYNSKKEFIAAQGPLAGTVKDFWRMIWEKNVHSLVMLTRCNEQGRVKCEQYWHSTSKHFEYIRVTTTSEIPLDDWTIRDFDIKNVKTAETRSVRQFHFTAWPDHGVPETTELLIGFRHLVREHMDQYSTNSPAVVHCSAGVGRTGTFIAIDRLLFQIERENVVDVYGVVHDLRMHRPLMVQTEDQYVFLNQCAMDIIRSRTGTNVDLIYQNTAALSIYENVEPRKGYYKQGYPST
ncbi:receptor-type tyrosine-protein phosphatase eta isoform X2 [Corythoichthys intestinalis]|uniref:receptor-type tyrosine-protein phosphatase eta isoform X2 n=1 Tax=Corythoichthys intestinalis TaxID=161448 RepID=UPI0025A5CBBA|nr:receptor-type tyrosine-protein phosphatase eta isoform X2 [Corythoichthys intestinalis]